jgi:hypothetical protein
MVASKIRVRFFIDSITFIDFHACIFSNALMTMGCYFSAWVTDSRTRFWLCQRTAEQFETLASTGSPAEGKGTDFRDH